jgi:hypothetical protein
MKETNWTLGWRRGNERQRRIPALKTELASAEADRLIHPLCAGATAAVARTQGLVRMLALASFEADVLCTFASTVGDHRVNCRILLLTCVSFTNALAQTPFKPQEVRAQQLVIRSATLIDSGRYHTVIVSPSGTRVAIIQPGPTAMSTLRIRALPSGKLLRTEVNLPATQVAWSRNEERLYYVANFNGGCGILELASGKRTALPTGCLDLRNNGVTGQQEWEMRVYWIDDSTVVGGIGARKSCNLMSLTCGTSSPEQISRTPRKEMRYVTLGYRGIAFFATSREDGSIRVLRLPGGGQQANDLDFLPSLGGAVVAHDLGAWLIEFGSVDAGPLAFQFDLATLAGPYAERVRRAIHEQGLTLDAVVYAPQLNPINNRVVGENKSRTRGLLHFEGECDGKIYARMREHYEPVHAGDVVTNLHTNLEGQTFDVPWRVLATEQFVDSIPACALARPNVAARPESGATTTSATGRAPAVGDASTMERVLRTVPERAAFEPPVERAFAAAPVVVYEVARRAFLAENVPLKSADSRGLVLIAEREVGRIATATVRYLVTIDADSATAATSHVHVQVLQFDHLLGSKGLPNKASAHRVAVSTLDSLEVAVARVVAEARAKVEGQRVLVSKDSAAARAYASFAPSVWLRRGVMGDRVTFQSDGTFQLVQDGKPFTGKYRLSGDVVTIQVAVGPTGFAEAFDVRIAGATLLRGTVVVWEKGAP